MDESHEQGYYAVITAEVLEDERLSDKAKILCALISSLAKKSGYAYATNQWLADQKPMRCSVKTISRLINDLEEAGHIHVEINTSDGNSRRIFLGGVWTKMSRGYGQKCPEGMDKNVQSTISNSTDKDSDKGVGSFTNGIKNENRAVNNEIVFPFSEPQFLSVWGAWKKYKAQEHRFRYKSAQSEQLALHQLHNLSGGDCRAAVEIIAQSMANGWKGFFALKTNNQNGQRQEPDGDKAERIGKKIDALFADKG
jgi:hypothetical protein